ncbi:hypothetical protein J2Z40_001159 [Cytobacillus eiseniae]|uniref:VWFA domain-containing protein n=1 Tax=Cytobacillus eiseniae TaxID=762947 RepID=A0ABS4RFN3_9BACI|nr:VWA domain-containing protein [Cytobacillus eiseniae]MBP2240602.1 hypothetical protein [Cytobacillus eiseniae]
MKNKGKWLIVLLAFHFILHLSFSSLTVSANGLDTPSIDYTVKPSQNEIVKPQNSDAEGSLDFHLTPSGKTTNVNRDPIDVVFIFDKSGSMKDSGKLQSAKNAMTEAINFFKENAGPKDNFAFIPFGSDVESIVNFWPADIKKGLDEINKKANSLYAEGGTNYTQSFEKALELFKGSNNNKYILFMTDGEPTFSNNKEVRTFQKSCFFCWGNKTVTEEVLVNYELYGSSPNFSSSKVYFKYDGSTYNLNLRINETIQAIRQHGEKRAQLIAEQNIKLYSIGFGSNKDVDMEYLRKLSAITGVSARQATQDNISSIFREISGDMDTPSITGEVKINLDKFKGNVKLIEGSDATLINNKASMKFNFKFPINQEVSQPIDLTLPLSFSEIGKYTFDDITMSYINLDGELVTKKHGPVTIEVKADAPPTFRGTMSLEGVINTPDNLIKVSGSAEKSNHFKVNYALNPFGLVDNKVTGKLTNIKIIQPLPDGVSLIPSSGITAITTPDGKNAAQINLSHEINYSSGKFNPSQLTASIQLKGEWAINNVKMPLATVHYKDSRFGDHSSSIAASNQVINLKVRLMEMPNNAYDGEATGIISKIDLNQNGAKLAQTEFPNNYGLKNKAIKDMAFTGEKNTAIEVTYFDNEKVTIYLQPDYEMIGTKTGNKYKSGDKALETIHIKLSNLVAGKGVKYYYSIDNDQENIRWTEFDPSQLIEVATSGLNTIKVKAIGGFALEDIKITKTIKIEKPIEKITITPNPIEVEVDKTKPFKIEIEPLDATNKKLDITIENSDKAELIDEKTILGKEDGETYLIVKTTDGSEIEVKIKIIVKDPYIVLKEIKFTKPVYKIEKGKKLAVKDLLIFNPIKATKRELESVTSSMQAQVDIVNENGEWFIVGKDIGYSTITVEAEEQKDKTQPKASALFEIYTEKDGNDNGPPGGGKW